MKSNIDNKNAPRIVHSHDIHLDSEYVQWIYDVKNRFRNTQIKAAIKINSEQLLFNWKLGRDLITLKSTRKMEKRLFSKRYSKSI